MVLMLLWLMSNVVRVLQKGMTAVIGQSDNSPSATHWENSFASGTSIDCRQPEQISCLGTANKAHSNTYSRYRTCCTIMVSVLWWMLRVVKFDLIQDRP